MKYWIEPADVIVPAEILDIVDGNILIAKTLIRRGINDADSARQFLNPDLYTPASPYIDSLYDILFFLKRSPNDTDSTRLIFVGTL